MNPFPSRKLILRELRQLSKFFANNMLIFRIYCQNKPVDRFRVGSGSCSSGRRPTCPARLTRRPRPRRAVPNARWGPSRITRKLTKNALEHAAHVSALSLTRHSKGKILSYDLKKKRTCGRLWMDTISLCKVNIHFGTKALYTIIVRLR